ncbi:MAG: molybdopterin-dependent oxidoreductase [Anaerolineae bacterium]
MLVRFVNTSILVLILVSLFTGVYVIFYNAHLWLMEIHRISSWGLIALIPWKAVIVLASLRRGWDWSRFDRGAGMVFSLVLAWLAVTATGLALMWTWRLGPFTLALYQTVIAWHWILALILLIPLTIHVVRRWPKPKAEDFTSRRGLLRSGLVLLAGVLGWGTAETIARARATEEEPRRQTGSRGMGLYTGNDFPITGEWIDPVDVSTWRLRITGAVENPITMTYDQVLARQVDTWDATLDCTLGWYSTQFWHGVPLRDLLEEAGVDPGAVGGTLKAVSGYTMPYPMHETEHILLCTHVGDEVLDHRHGYPLRAVSPNRRGWFWVKWLTEVRVHRVLPDFSALIDRVENA